MLLACACCLNYPEFSCSSYWALTSVSQKSSSRSQLGKYSCLPIPENPLQVLEKTRWELENYRRAGSSPHQAIQGAARKAEHWGTSALLPKRWSAANQHGSTWAQAVRVERDVQPLSWHVSRMAYHPRRVPARAHRYHRPDCSLPPPSHIFPKSKHGSWEHTTNSPTTCIGTYLQAEPKIAFLLPSL